MTKTSIGEFSSGLLTFVDKVKADEALQHVFNELLNGADSEGGKAAIIARAADIGAPITINDLETLKQAFAADAGALDDAVLDGVGGGTTKDDDLPKAYGWPGLSRR